MCELSQEKVSEKSCGKAKFSRSLARKVDCTWLHYQESNDCVVCHTCAKAFKELKMHVESAGDAFVTTGISEFKVSHYSVSSARIKCFP